MKLPHDTWVLVTDSEKYLLLRNRGDDDIMDLRVREHEEHENPPTHEQGAHRPGRMHDGGPNHRSAVDDTDWHALEKERFASELADKLYCWTQAGRFDSLVLIADPRTLGHVRDELHSSVEKRVLAEISKNLTNHPVEAIQKVIEAS